MSRHHYPDDLSGDEDGMTAAVMESPEPQESGPTTWLCSKEHAIALFDRLDGLMVDTGRVILELIECRAWEPLGYGDFAWVWNERMRGFFLNTDRLKAAVVYALLETLTVEEVADCVTGISEESIRILERQKNGVVPVPPELASPRRKRSAPISVRKYDRAPATPSGKVTYEFDVDELREWERLAEGFGSSVHELGEIALRRRFTELKKAAAKRASQVHVG